VRLEWTLDPPDRQPACGALRSKTGKVRCELPWDHIVGTNHTPMRWDFHTGRNRAGTWLSWPESSQDHQRSG
jgi:hypothetical protein